MLALDAAGRAQIGRILRLVLFALLAQPLIAALVSTWVARFPLVGAVIAALEVVYRTVRPVEAAKPPFAVAPPRHAASADGSPPVDYSVLPGPPSAEVYTPVTPDRPAPWTPLTAAPEQSPEGRPDPAPGP